MSAQLARKLFNVKQYEQLIESGFFVGKKGVELLEGELIEKMTQGHLHISHVSRLMTLFVSLLLGKATVIVQSPIVVNEFSEPEPDVTILRYREDFYSSRKARPEDVLLAIEVSDSTASFDRRIKIPLYARTGIVETWLVNLPRKILEVHRNPNNGKYTVVQKLNRMETISPLNFPELTLKILDIIG